MVKVVKQKHGGTLKVLEKGETANPNGRPKSSVRKIIDELRYLGIEPARASDITDIYMQLLNTDRKKLFKIYGDNDQPILVQVVARHLLYNNNTFDIVEKMLDRGIGKSIQQVKAAVVVANVDNPLEDRLKELGLH